MPSGHGQSWMSGNGSRNGSPTARYVTLIFIEILDYIYIVSIHIYIRQSWMSGNGSRNGSPTARYVNFNFTEILCVYIHIVSIHIYRAVMDERERVEERQPNSSVRGFNIYIDYMYMYIDS
jgi:hypothetical protein